MSAALDTAYQAQRRRLTATVSATVKQIFLLGRPETETVAQIIPLVEGGQHTMAELVAGYMSVKALEHLGAPLAPTLDPAAYTIAQLRLGKLTAEEIYGRPFTVMLADLRRNGGDMEAAARSGASLAEKLAATDIQLAQTHAARDWLHEAEKATEAGTVKVVGYRRVLTGTGPHCALCEAASTRTYRVSDLMPIHEHCTCMVQPLFGTEPVASVGTALRVEEDPELGPRLMADSWSPVGPRIDLG